MNFNDIATRFYTAGTKYSAAIQPYAVKLFVALLLIDILVTWIQFTAEGQLDAPHFLGRLIKHILSGGFVYLMIVNAFSWMNRSSQEFFCDRSISHRASRAQSAKRPQDRCQHGRAHLQLSRQRQHDDQLRTGDRPEHSRVHRSARLRGHGFDAFADSDRILSGSRRRSDSARTWSEPIHGALPRKATLAMSSASASDFSSFYLVLAIGVQMANEWNAALVAACKPVPCHPALVDHIRSTSQRQSSRPSAPERFPVRQCSTIAALSIVFMIVMHRRASHGGQHRRRDDRPRAQPRLRSSLRCSDDHSTDHKRASDRIQQGRSDRQR